MSTSSVSIRYAKALVDIGIANDTHAQLGRELDRVLEIYGVDEVIELFRNPKFSIAVRKTVLGDFLQRMVVSPTCRNFLFLLIERDRFKILPEIVSAYHRLADAHTGRLRAKARVPRKLDESSLARLRAVLQKKTGREVVIEQEIDPSLIGGVVTQLDGRVYDGSVRTQLETLRMRLKQGRI